MEPKKYMLKNVVQEFGWNDDEFWLPTDAVIRKLRPNDDVVIIFEATRNLRMDGKDIGGERLWVRITKADYPYFKGRIDANDPKHVHVNYGETLEFTNEHISKVMFEPDMIEMRKILDRSPPDEIPPEEIGRFLRAISAHFTTWDDRLTVCPVCHERINLVYNEETQKKEFMCSQCDAKFDFVTLQPISP